MPASLRVCSDLLETLYAATLEPSRWHGFLQGLCDATDSVVAFLVRNDSSKGRQVLASGGVELPADFERGYMTADPVREAFMRRPRTGILEVEDFLPRRRLMQSSYYPVMAASGVTYGTCIVPRLSTRRFDLIAIWRGDDRVRLEPSSAELVERLYPHIQIALQIHQALGDSRARAEDMEEMLDSTATATLLVSSMGKVLHRNRAAARLTANSAGLAERDGHLCTTRTEQQPELQRLIADAATPRPASGAMLLHRGEGRRPLQVLVSTLPGSRAGKPRRVLVLACDPDCHPQFPDRVLKKLYGFTRAETDLANGFLTGLSPEAMAAVRGVSLDTVRTQIKSLLLKTNTQRQVDLIRLLHAIPSLHEH